MDTRKDVSLSERLEAMVIAGLDLYCDDVARKWYQKYWSERDGFYELYYYGLRRTPTLRWTERTTAYPTFGDWLREYAGEHEWEPTFCSCGGGRRYRRHGDNLWDEVWDQVNSICLEALGLETGEVLDGTTQEAACEYDEELDDYIHQLVCDVRVIIESGCPETSEEHNALEPH